MPTPQNQQTAQSAKSTNIIDYNNWDRSILKAYWVIVTLISIAEFVMLIMQANERTDFSRLLLIKF